MWLRKAVIKLGFKARFEIKLMLSGGLFQSSGANTVKALSHFVLVPLRTLGFYKFKNSNNKIEKIDKIDNTIE